MRERGAGRGSHRSSSVERDGRAALACFFSCSVPMLDAVTTKLNKKGTKSSSWPIGRAVEYMESILDEGSSHNAPETPIVSLSHISHMIARFSFSTSSSSASSSASLSFLSSNQRSSSFSRAAFLFLSFSVFVRSIAKGRLIMMRMAGHRNAKGNSLAS